MAPFGRQLGDDQVGEVELAGGERSSRDEGVQCLGGGDPVQADQISR